MKLVAVIALLTGHLAMADQTICGKVKDVAVEVAANGAVTSSVLLESSNTSVRIANPKPTEFPIPMWTATSMINLETEALKSADLQFCAETKGPADQLELTGGHLSAVYR